MIADHSSNFIPTLTLFFFKVENGMLKKVLLAEKTKCSLLGIKKGYQSKNLYMTNDIQWVLLLKLLCLCITLLLLLYNCFALLLPVYLLELKPSNSSLNLFNKNTT